MKNSRRDAREAALKVLYAQEFSGSALDDILSEQIAELGEQASAFCRDLVKAVLSQREHLDRLIQKRSENWEFDRIAIIDRILLRMAISEFLYFEDIPPKVSINESIEIAKKYSTNKSGKFVNGILDSAWEELSRDAEVKKTGRGVLDS